MPYTLPALPYATTALEPHVDARTMEIHHTKHHQAYITNVNKALEGSPLADKPIDDLMRRRSRLLVAALMLSKNSLPRRRQHDSVAVGLGLASRLMELLL